ncbi:MAG TPA: hypothetical protein VJ787_04230 [Thermoleophilia bacterium]|nr:hypothetical protein [Thermoleophilia bacterium]
MVDQHDVAALAEHGDAAILRAALRLEEEAVARYVEHGSRTTDPRLIAFWEALRRNEAEHRDGLRKRLAALTKEDTAATMADASHVAQDAAAAAPDASPMAQEAAP